MKTDFQDAAFFPDFSSPAESLELFEENSALSDPVDDLPAEFARRNKERQELAQRYLTLRKEAVQHVRQLVRFFQIKGHEIDCECIRGSSVSRAAETGSKDRVPVKYSGPAGETWSGRGKLPNWLKDEIARGAKLEDFLA